MMCEKFYPNFCLFAPGSFGCEDCLYGLYNDEIKELNNFLF